MFNNLKVVLEVITSTDIITLLPQVLFFIMLVIKVDTDRGSAMEKKYFFKKNHKTGWEEVKNDFFQCIGIKLQSFIKRFNVFI